MKRSARKKVVGEGMAYTRLRRLTGYLAGTIDSFNDSKYVESNKSVNSVNARQY